MKSTSIFRAVSAIATVTFLAACTANILDTHNAALELVTELRSRGLTAEDTGVEIHQPFFNADGWQITANGADVQVYVYDTEAAAVADVTQISTDGSTIGTSNVNWMQNPHFYRKEKTLVLYLGSDINVMAALEDVLGAQIAGTAR